MHLAMVAAFAYISKPHFGHDASVGLHPKEIRATARPNRSESGFPRAADGASLTH